jgi:hypothetical protein
MAPKVYLHKYYHFNKFNETPIVKFRVALLNQQVTIQTKKVNHGDLRADRPTHGRVGRASKDGLAACRRVNAMVSLYGRVSVNLFMSVRPEVV